MEATPRPPRFEGSSSDDVGETHRDERPAPRRLAVPISRMSEFSTPDVIPVVQRAHIPQEAMRRNMFNVLEADLESGDDDDDEKKDKDSSTTASRTQPVAAIEPALHPSAEVAPPSVDEALLAELRSKLAAAEQLQQMNVAAEVSQEMHANPAPLSAEEAPAQPARYPEAEPAQAFVHVSTDRAPAAEVAPLPPTPQPEVYVYEDPYERDVLFLPYDSAAADPANVREAVVPAQYDAASVLERDGPYTGREFPVNTDIGAPEDRPDMPAVGANLPPGPPEGPRNELGAPSPDPENVSLYNTAGGNEGSGAAPTERVAASNVPRSRFEGMLTTQNNRLNARVNRAAIIGLGLLGMERHFRRKADKELEKRIDQSQLESAKQGRQVMAEQRRQADEQYAQRVKQERFGGVPASGSAFERSDSRDLSQAERSAQANLIEQQKLGEQAQSEAERQRIELEEGQEVRSSVWHNAVVKDGRVVEGAIEYGAGFKGEQRELRHDPMADDRPQASVPTGVGAAFPYLSGGVDPSHMFGTAAEPALPPGVQPPDPNHRLAPRTKQPITSNITSPWFWIMLAIVGIGLLTAIAVFH